jgi:hypothetical protein
VCKHSVDRGKPQRFTQREVSRPDDGVRGQMITS